MIIVHVKSLCAILIQFPCSQSQHKACIYAYNTTIPSVHWANVQHVPLYMPSICFALSCCCHYGDVIWAQWRLKSPTTWLFVQRFIHADIMETSIPPSATLCEETPLSHRVSNAESVSKSWHHHVIISVVDSCNTFTRIFQGYFTPDGVTLMIHKTIRKHQNQISRLRRFLHLSRTFPNIDANRNIRYLLVKILSDYGFMFWESPPKHLWKKSCA